MRGQVVIEFLLFTTVAVLMGVTFLVIVTSGLRDAGEDQRFAELSHIGFMLQDELILAESVHPGYSRTITVPETAGRFPYNITASGDHATLSSGNMILDFALPPFAGVIMKGPNTIRMNGTIEVMQ
jgi:hypothetical protein